jgi:hypothetical protein
MRESFNASSNRYPRNPIGLVDVGPHDPLRANRVIENLGRVGIPDHRLERHRQLWPVAARPGVVSGHGGAELDRLRAELEELTGKPVQLNMFKDDGPPEGRKEIKIGPELAADWSPPSGPGPAS